MIWPFSVYPFTNMHDLNLDWILQEVKTIPAKVDASVASATDRLRGAVINVQSIGVSPDKSGVENAAILNNRALVPIGANIYFPAGVYPVDGSVNLSNSMRVSGDGEHLSEIVFTDGGFIVRGGDVSSIDVAINDVKIRSSGTPVDISGAACYVGVSRSDIGSVRIVGAARVFADCATMTPTVSANNNARIMFTNCNVTASNITGTAESVSLLGCNSNNASVIDKAKNVTISSTKHSGGEFHIVTDSVCICGSEMSTPRITGTAVSYSVSGSTFINHVHGGYCAVFGSCQSGHISGCAFNPIEGSGGQIAYVGGANQAGVMQISACSLNAQSTQTAGFYIEYCTVYVNNLQAPSTLTEIARSYGAPLYVLAGDYSRFTSANVVRKISYT